MFDGDDTLWQTEFLYDRARDRSAAIAASVGIDADEFRETQRLIDVENVAKLGLSRTRFPTSSLEAYKTLGSKAGFDLSEVIGQQIYDASATVFTDTAPLYEGVERVLEQLVGGYRIALLTKGDEQIQLRRLEHSGLGSYFEYVSVVAEKSTPEFRQILKHLDVDVEGSWSIGNSLRSDIQPALDLGMSAIWIDQYVWAHEANQYETHDHPRLFLASEIEQVPNILKMAF